MGIWALGLSLAIAADDAVSELELLIRKSGGTVLVGAAGEDVEKAVEKLQKKNPSLNIRVVRVATAGDPEAEMKGVLEKASLRCGARASFAEDKSLVLDAYGDCTRQQKFVAPAGASAPAPEKVAEFERRKLQRVTLQDESGKPTGWAVQNGAGETLGPVAFATLIGDTLMLDTLEQEKTSSRRLRTELYIGSGVSVLLGSALFVTQEDLDQYRFSSEERRSAAIRNDTRFYGGSALVTGSVMGTAMGYFLAPTLAEQQAELPNYYREREVDQRVDAFNRSLRQELGVFETPLKVEVVVPKEKEGDDLDKLLLQPPKDTPTDGEAPKDGEKKLEAPKTDEKKP